MSVLDSLRRMDAANRVPGSTADSLHPDALRHRRSTSEPWHHRGSTQPPHRRICYEILRSETREWSRPPHSDARQTPPTSSDTRPILGGGKPRRSSVLNLWPPPAH